MTEFTPTPEQLTCIEAAKGDDNLLISALAGAAKTSTLVLIAEALPKTQALCLAFNKRIQVEMNNRLPPNCKAMTLNGLGHKAWSDTTGRFCKVDKDKVYNLLRKEVDDLTGEDKKEVFEKFGDIKNSISNAKTAGYIPDGHFPSGKPLMNDEELYHWLAEEPTPLVWDLIRTVSIESMKLAFKGQIDFDDQVLMPTVFQAIFPRYPLVLVDEAQDLSALNHAMIRKIARKRLIAVGDECQSIYGFRGAHQNSMRLLREEFSMTERVLSVSFRCPRSVVEHARWRAPHMKYPEWAKEGEVHHLASWSVDDLPDDAAIICRNNAPIFSMAIKLLKNGRYPQVIGADIGRNLIKMMKKLGPMEMKREAALRACTEWEEKKKEKSRDPGKIKDQAACMRIFITQGETLEDAIAYADHILSLHGTIKMMTGHKAKGLEFDHVFILDRPLIRTDKSDQEKNLLYVMQTRAKRSLTYIYSEEFIDETNDDEES